MLPGPRAAALADTAVDPLGWRIANFLAIAAPYLLAAVLFAVLYMQPTTPPAHAVGAPSSAGDAAQPVEPAAASASAPVATRSAEPEPVKSAASTAATPAKNTAAPAIQKEEPAPTGPVSVQPDVAETMKLPGDAVAYPAAAMAAHIQGVVVLAVGVGADGNVQTVEPVSGPALLEVGALGAVRSWRYRPWLVQGHAVPFTTQVTISFEIGTSPQ